MNVSLTLSLLLASASLAADKPVVVKLESPPKSEWQVIPCDPALTTLSLDAPGEWFLIDEGNARLKPAADGKTAEFAAEVDGHYRVLVVCGKQAHRIELVRAAAPPPQPMPMPMPPGPDPKPPAPADPLVKALQAAYEADARAKDAKQPDLLLLVELYKQMVPYADASEFTTAEQLVAKLHETTRKLQVTRLVEVRRAIAAELRAAFPEDTPLTADERKKAATLFGRIKTCLESVK